MDCPLVPSRAAVIAACNINGPKENGLAYSNEIWIKYGLGVTQAEAVLQQFVHLNADPRILYTPAVYDHFTEPKSHGMSVTYIVMERVSGTSPAGYIKQHPDKVDVILDKIATAIRHLWELPLPEQSLIGPLQGQKAKDWFFSDYGADQTFNNVDDLENWINNKLKDTRVTEPVDLKPFPCHICHCDLSHHNILYNDLVIILDWGMSGVYPWIFEEFALVRQFNVRGAKFVKLLHKKLFGDKPSSVIRPLMAVSNLNAFGS